MVLRDWQFITYGLLCALCYANGFHPFLHYMGAVMLLFELSSILPAQHPNDQCIP